jgi:hypothetical protein
MLGLRTTIYKVPDLQKAKEWYSKVFKERPYFDKFYYVGFTLLFEAFSMLLIEHEMLVNKAAKIVQVYPNRFWYVFNYWISRAYNKDEIANLDKAGFFHSQKQKEPLNLIGLESLIILKV